MSHPRGVDPRALYDGLRRACAAQGLQVGEVVQPRGRGQPAVVTALCLECASVLHGTAPPLHQGTLPSKAAALLALAVAMRMLCDSHATASCVSRDPTVRSCAQAAALARRCGDRPHASTFRRHLAFATGRR